MSVFDDKFHELKLDELRHEPENDDSTNASDGNFDSLGDLEPKVDMLMQCIYTNAMQTH